MPRKISNFNASDRDYEKLLANALRDCSPEAAEHVFVGVDEGLNDERVFDMIDAMTKSGLVRSGSPLWREIRMSDEGSENYIYGGVSSRNKRLIQAVNSKLGAPVRGVSDDDATILDYLVIDFLSYGRVVLLTADKTFRTRGEFFGPLLAKHQPPLSMTALFKQSSSVAEYCLNVSHFLRVGSYEPGYSELFL